MPGSSSDRKQKGKELADEREPLLQPNNPPADYLAASRDVEAGLGRVSTEEDEQHELPFMSAGFRKVLIYLVGYFTLAGLVVYFVYLLRPGDLQEELTRVPQLNVEDISLDSLTSDGVNIHVTGYVEVDYEKAMGSSWRTSLIRRVASVMKTVALDNQTVSVYIEEPEDDVSQKVLKRTANATVPNMTVDIVDGHLTKFDYVVQLYDFGSPMLMASIVQRILYNERMQFEAHTHLTLHKWGLPLGPFDVTLRQVINEPRDDDPEGPGDLFGLDISNVRVVSNPEVGTKVSASVALQNPLSVSATIPEFNWNLRIDGCKDGEDRLEPQFVSVGSSETVEIIAHGTVNVSVSTNIAQLPVELLLPCNGSQSPLDQFASTYLAGEVNRIFVQGAETQSSETPEWLTKALQAISLSFPFRGKSSSDELIRSLEFHEFRVDFPGSGLPGFRRPDQTPRVSALVEVTIAIPRSIHIDRSVLIEVPYTRGVADLLSEGELFAHISIDEWVKCDTEPGEDEGTYVAQFQLDSVPVEVVDQTVFGRVMREVVLSGSSAVRVEAVVDADVVTPLGEILLTDLPASGDTEIRSKAVL